MQYILAYQDGLGDSRPEPYISGNLPLRRSIIDTKYIHLYSP